MYIISVQKKILHDLNADKSDEVVEIKVESESENFIQTGSIIGQTIPIWTPAVDLLKEVYIGCKPHYFCEERLYDRQINYTVMVIFPEDSVVLKVIPTKIQALFLEGDTIRKFIYKSSRKDMCAITGAEYHDVDGIDGDEKISYEVAIIYLGHVCKTNLIRHPVEVFLRWKNA